ncbi:hypothetical protein ACG04R_02290 [Roseateles sp. BYS78W]|uniref:DUF4864 domain-containing protein n=1 Tax=Pelomonas candidula TaxID=3299025 RepID=A0ABW7H7G5_9BURK
MRLAIAPLLSLCLLGPCVAADTAAEAPTPPASAASEAAKPGPTLHQRVYQLQHRLIPNWVHKSSGAFYTALAVGDLARLREVASELVSPEYAAGIKVTPYPALEGVLIEYPTPQTSPLCYFEFVHVNGKSSTGYEIYTYEKTLKLPGLDYGYGVVGRWTPEGAHANMGGRNYQDAESFVRDLKLDKEPSKTAEKPT